MLLLLWVQKKRGLHRLRLLRYRQTPYDHITSKSPRLGVSIRAITLGRLNNFGEISGDKNLSGRFFMYV